jgi:23S rRNA pseudouridine1911/1915/1917 synthase
VIETIPAGLAGERLDRVVSMLTGASRATAADWVATGRVQVDGSVVTARALRLTEGDVVAVDGAEPESSVPGAEPAVAVAVVYEDDDVVVVDKPSGLVVHPGAGNPTGTLVSGLLARFPEIAEVGDRDRPGIVHRIDKDTSGLLMVARSAQGYDALTAQLAARTVSRSYQVLVWGHLQAPRGAIDAPIGRSTRSPTRMTVSAAGRSARTGYTVTATWADPAPLSRLTCRLETGRTHQIRVHLAAIDHPVVGDDRYGGRRAPLADVPRFFLHAGSLAFDHPVTGDRLEFTSPLPADLAGVLDRLGAPSPVR